MAKVGCPECAGHRNTVQTRDELLATGTSDLLQLQTKTLISWFDGAHHKNQDQLVQVEPETLGIGEDSCWSRISISCEQQLGRPAVMRMVRLLFHPPLVYFY